MAADAKVARCRREAARAERERIRGRLRSHLGALITARADEYGQGWNAAVRQVMSALGD